MDIPSGLNHIKMIAALGEQNRRLTSSKLDNYKGDLKLVGISLSIFYQASTCHRKCFGGPHILEGLAGRTYNLACSAYTLICRGFYDEALCLVRSMGEISNLIALSIVDKASFQKWLSSDTKARLRDFSPAKIRNLLEENGKPLMYADKDWYSKFCEDYTHVHPQTKPNVHNENGQPHVGGLIQDQGMKFSISELANICAQIAVFISKYADLDDLFEELWLTIQSSQDYKGNKKMQPPL